MCQRSGELSTDGQPSEVTELEAQPFDLDLRLSALAHVLQLRDEVQRPSLRIADNRDGQQCWNLPSIFMDVAFLELVVIDLSFDRAIQEFHIEKQVVRMRQLLK